MPRASETKMALPCKLTDDEKLTKGKALSAELRRCENLENDLSRYKKSISNQIEESEATIQMLRHEIDTGEEMRQVECSVVYDWEHKTKSWIRNDTGEEVQHDIIPEHELQEEMEIAHEAEDRD